MPTFDHSDANLDRIGDNHCHPSNAVRTMCRCGRKLSLGRSEKGNTLGPPVVTCECGRAHRKASGGWRGYNNGGQREGGSAGCCGLRLTEAETTAARAAITARSKAQDAELKLLTAATRRMRKQAKR